MKIRNQEVSNRLTTLISELDLEHYGEWAGRSEKDVLDFLVARFNSEIYEFKMMPASVSTYTLDDASVFLSHARASLLPFLKTIPHRTLFSDDLSDDMILHCDNASPSKKTLVIHVYTNGAVHYSDAWSLSPIVDVLSNKKDIGLGGPFSLTVNIDRTPNHIYELCNDFQQHSCCSAHGTLFFANAEDQLEAAIEYSA